MGWPSGSMRSWHLGGLDTDAYFSSDSQLCTVSMSFLYSCCQQNPNTDRKKTLSIDFSKKQSLTYWTLSKMIEWIICFFNFPDVKILKQQQTKKAKALQV